MQVQKIMKQKKVKNIWRRILLLEYKETFKLETKLEDNNVGKNTNY